MDSSHKLKRPWITLVTETSKELTALFLPTHPRVKQSIILKVFPNEAFYFDTAYSIEKSHHTHWIEVDQDTFIKAATLRALGGYDYVHELLKDQI